MNSTALGQITSMPTNLWFVQVNGNFDSKWGSRRLARIQKTKLAGYGVVNITLSRAAVTVSSPTVDTHS